MPEHFDLVTELDRSARLDDDSGSEVVGDAAQREHGHRADEQAGGEDGLNGCSEEAERDPEAEHPGEVLGHPRGELAQVLVDALDSGEHPPNGALGEAAEDPARRDSGDGEHDVPPVEVLTRDEVGDRAGRGLFA